MIFLTVFSVVMIPYVFGHNKNFGHLYPPGSRHMSQWLPTTPTQCVCFHVLVQVHVYHSAFVQLRGQPQVSVHALHLAWHSLLV